MHSSPSYLPTELIDALSRLSHFEPGDFKAVHASGTQLVSVHLNRKKPVPEGEWTVDDTQKTFRISGKIPWAPDAYYLAERPSFTLDPLFHAGCYYVQEASGMFLAFALEHAAGLSKNLKVLDLCAAPGGKSTMLQSLLSADSLLVSNEVIKTRVPILYQNLTKWGGENGIVSNNDPAHFKSLPGFFDCMLIDAPCSGSGLYRKDPDAAASWSTELVNLCSQRQQRILADAWDCLKQEGVLIYSTCSYSKEENEDILDSIFRQHECESVRLHPDQTWGIIETQSDEANAYGYRFYPDKLSGEGFFLAVIRKQESTGRQKVVKSNARMMPAGKTIEQQMASWVNTGQYRYVPVGDAVHLLPVALSEEIEIIRNTLYLKKAGIRLGKAGEKDWIPDHELALANILKQDVPALHVSLAEARHFLRGEPFDGPDGKGWRVIRYRGQALGWVKLLDRRMNNYFPKSWRIRL